MFFIPHCLVFFEPCLLFKIFACVPDISYGEIKRAGVRHTPRFGPQLARVIKSLAPDETLFNRVDEDGRKDSCTNGQ